MGSVVWYHSLLGTDSTLAYCNISDKRNTNQVTADSRSGAKASDLLHVVVLYSILVSLCFFFKCSTCQMLKCAVLPVRRCHVCAVVQHVWCAGVVQTPGTPLWPGSFTPSSYCCGPSSLASCCRQVWMSSSKGYERPLKIRFYPQWQTQNG